MWSASRSYKEDSWGNQVGTVRESVKTGIERVKLLKSITRKRLVKTLQAEEDLVCSDLWSAEMSDSIMIICSYDL
jgi:hypothetical protein